MIAYVELSMLFESIPPFHYSRVPNAIFFDVFSQRSSSKSKDGLDDISFAFHDSEVNHQLKQMKTTQRSSLLYSYVELSMVRRLDRGEKRDSLFSLNLFLDFIVFVAKGGNQSS